MVLLFILFLRFINIALGNVVDAAYSFPKIFFTRFKTIDEDEDEDEDDEDKVADIIRRLATGKYVWQVCLYMYSMYKVYVIYNIKRNICFNFSTELKQKY